MAWEIRAYENAHRFSRWAIEEYKDGSPAVRVESLDADGQPWCVSTREAGPFASFYEAQNWLLEHGLQEDQWE